MRRKAQACKAAQAEVAYQWALAARVDEAFLWVKRADQGSIREVLKYSLKPGSLCRANLPVRPLVEAMKGRHLVAAWGSVRKEARALREAEESQAVPLMCANGHVGTWDFAGRDGLPPHRSCG